MSVIDAHPLPGGGSGRVLTIGTFVLASAAAVVLGLGTYDARLLRLGLIAALWAALFGAFAVAQMRRDSSSCADHVDQLRMVYQLELEREVAARREHILTVERELREQAELSQRREIVELRAELAAMRANLDQLVGGASLAAPVVARAESARVFPLPTHPRKFDDIRSRTVAAAGVVSATPSPASAELRFGPGWAMPSHGRHGGAGPSAVPIAQGQQEQQEQQGQRTVSDLLAANGVDPVFRRRRNHDGRG
jgi:hypothetical protein